MSHPFRILIDGVGLVSPLGRSAWSTFSALLAGRCLTDRLSAGDDRGGLGELALEAQVGQIGKAWGVHPGSPDPAIDLAESAARQALLDAGQAIPGTAASLGVRQDGEDAIPVIVATSKGAMVAWESAVRGFFRDKVQHHPAAAAMLGLEPNINPSELARVVAMGPATWLGEQLGRRLGADVAMQPSVVAACASGLVAIDQARRKLLSPGGPSRCLVVATEAALLPVLIHSYRRLGVLATDRRRLVPGRPLHPDRGGFVLAQLAAAVLLRREACSDSVADKPGAIELFDTAVANETHDLIRPAPGMPALDRVASQLLESRPVTALHPHATGTREHDPAELEVLERYLSRPSAVYACKGAVGHGLGAAGLVSLVLGCLSVRTGRLPPMPWLDRVMEMPGRKGMLVARPEGQRLGQDACRAGQPSGIGAGVHAIFAAGFGGHTAGAVIGGGGRVKD